MSSFGPIDWKMYRNHWILRVNYNRKAAGVLRWKGCRSLHSEPECLRNQSVANVGSRLVTIFLWGPAGGVNWY